MNSENHIEKEENKSPKDDIIIHSVNNGETVYAKKENEKKKEPSTNQKEESRKGEENSNQNKPKRRKRKRKKSVNLFLLVVFAFITGSIFTVCLLKWSPIMSYLDSSPKTN